MKRKRGSAIKISRKFRDTASSNLDKDEDIQIIKILLKRLKEKYNLSSTEVFNLAQKEEILIPISIFTKKLSPLETYVKYLKENLELDYSKIAELLGRSRKTVWQAYKNSVKKQSARFEPAETRYIIPVSSLETGLSILEATVVYLKERFGISYHEIGELLQRNERTVWTVYQRAARKQKLSGASNKFEAVKKKHV
ncbi:hypothetical protein KY342_05735 [Candidatus Woesearchaeota archaeon]|nr:hypothetical protein [Candidatus Woesearchaeota archaeon]